MTAFINRLGEIYNDLQIIKELGGGRVSCKCLKCTHIDEYRKVTLPKAVTLCKKCGKVNKAKIISRVEEIHIELEIIEDKGEGYVKCKLPKIHK